MDTSQTNAPAARQDGRGRRGNVIPMRLDAAFFHERGVKYLQRHDFERALKAFRKTVEYEPDNPVHHCNLAGVLAEMGDFAASNEVLLRVLEEIAPDMAEVQFYLANNYANMGEYEIAEEYVLRYLDARPDGEYAEDAREMLSILMDEFGGGKALARWQDRWREQEREAAKRDGRHLLEEGQFEAAVEWLEQVVRREPDNLAARNNLSLAYYYTGQYEEAVRGAEGVLAEQPHNLHALCNLALFSAHVGPKARLEACVQKLAKVFPLHYDLALKVGTTLGLVGQHQAAFSVFERLARIAAEPDPALYHCAAAAAANAGRFAAARRYWRLLARFAETEDLANYYLKQLDAAAAAGRRSLRVSYQYDLPLHEQFTEMKRRLQAGDLTAWRRDPLLRASLYWGLRHGDDETRRVVLRTLAWLADADAERAIRLFLKRPQVPPALQAAALFALQRCGARGRIDVWVDGEIAPVRMSALPKDLVLGIEPVWQEVWRLAEDWFKAHRKRQHLGRAKRLWVAFAEHAFLHGRVRVTRPPVWAAALVYVVMKRFDAGVRRKDVAADFAVAVPAVSRAAGRLQGFADGCAEDG
ncbi:tetratricopeptide repeat protein [Alicyclobacillus cellulosilyticus]|nr:tetratricopeptide repeat protein [Alicyclobacillus cellulosilyticus]